MKLIVVFAMVAFFAGCVFVNAQDEEDDTDIEGSDLPKIKSKIVADTQTDADTLHREELAAKLDGLSAEETKVLREKSEKHEFQAEVNRMMKLIINSLYKNKEIYLRELISNASDALDKIRLLSLTDKAVLGDTTDLVIKIHADKENRVLHITDTGLGMTKNDLIKNLGTIAKSGTSEFFAATNEKGADTSNLIGQFGVGFYSAFLVADRVVVTSKHNDDKQHIWESDANSFSVIEDPREDNQLGRGTRVSLYLKEEAQDYLEPTKLRDLIKKYSEFINFDIYLYTSKIVEEEVEVEEEEAVESETETPEAEVEEDKEETKSKKTEKVEKTVWDWELINANKPIWTRSAKDITDDEYIKFYKAFSREEKDPVTHVHFTVEGEVVFRSILYVPAEAPKNLYHEYGKSTKNIKLYVRRVFITDEFEDLIPKYLSFLRGVVDSDDLPLNVSRETLQQHKLLKVIKKKIVRKALEMFKKIEGDDYKKFWKEYGTSLKLGLIEDHNNRVRISKLLRYASSNDKEELTGLEAYVERMKKDQTHIFYMAGSTREEVEHSPFVERLIKRGYEVLYFIEPVDEYTIQNLPDFDGKKFQNVAKEGLELNEGEKAKERFEQLASDFEPLTKWLNENLKDSIEKAVVSNRLSESPCALVANAYGWSANMERVMKAQAYARSDDSSTDHYVKQKKTLEINPRHPLIKKLLVLVKADETAEDNSNQEKALDISKVLLDTARLRSGFTLQDSVSFAERIEKMLRLSAGVAVDEAVEEEPEPEPDTEEGAEEDEGEEEAGEDEEEETVNETPQDHEEL
jgi:heat shock protein beta